MYYIYQANKDTILDKNQYKKGEYISKNSSPTNFFGDAHIHVYHSLPTRELNKNFDTIPVSYIFKLQYSEEIKLK